MAASTVFDSPTWWQLSQSAVSPRYLMNATWPVHSFNGQNTEPPWKTKRHLWTVRIRGNEAADRAAKEALRKERVNDLMPFSDLKPLATRYIHQVWQKEWDEAIIVSNKLHDILPKLSDKLLTFCNTRKEDTVLNRLHVCHFYFTHSFLLKKRRTSCLHSM